MPQVTPPSHPTLFLVDGYALIYRAFFALLSRPLRTAKGENTSAAWGVVGFLQRLVEKHQPEYIAWIHDAGSSFRKEVYAEYKATREKLNEELQADFDRGLQRIEELLAAYRVQIVAIDGYEADDVIGTMTRLAVEQQLNVVIVSGDKDFQQCVKPGVWLLNPGRGGPASVDEQWVGMENASERLGVPPQFVTDYLAMTGDSSDNVPGVPGVGEKTAQELITAYGDLEQILARASEVTKKRPREALLAFADQARLSKTLVSIRDDVPVTLDLKRFERQHGDVPRLRQLFLELEFSTLLKGLETSGAAAAAGTPAPVVVDRKYQLCASPADVDALVARARASGEITLAIETIPVDGDPLRVRLGGLAIGLAIGLEPGEAWYVPLGHRAWKPPQGDLLLVPDNTPNAPEGTSLAARSLSRVRPDEVTNLPPLADASQASLRAVLEDPAVRKSGHDVKHALLVLRSHGIALRGIAFDTMLASYVLDPGRREHSLSVLALEFLDRTLPSHETLRGKGRQELGFDEVPIEVAKDFVCEYADAALQLRARLAPQLKEMGAESLFTSMELPLLDVLAEMEWAGVAIDIAWFRSLKARFQKERERVELEIYEVAGERFNINSNPQLRVILFEKLNLPVKKKTSTGPSTDASVLQELAAFQHSGIRSLEFT